LDEEFGMDFDGSPITSVEAKLPTFIVELPQGYRRGTHLRMEMDFRIRSVRYEENRKGELVQQLILAVEEVELKKVITPEEEVVSLGEAIQEDGVESERVPEIDGQVSLDEIYEETGEPGTDLAVREGRGEVGSDDGPWVTYADHLDVELAAETPGRPLMEVFAEFDDGLVSNLPYDTSVGF
jgi:hypothetical protein